MSRQKTVAPNSDIWERIKTTQAELHSLYEEATQYIFKETEGEAFLGEKNVSYAQYWIGAVKKSPRAVSGEFQINDFEVKTDLFSKFVEVYNTHNAAASILDGPYDILSKDVLRYATDAKKAFGISSDAVCKQALKDAPMFRKASSGKSKAEKAADKAAEKAAADKNAELALAN
jgi:hypothetical protein